MPSGLHPLTRAFPDVGVLNSPGLRSSGVLPEPGWVFYVSVRDSLK